MAGPTLRIGERSLTVDSTLVMGVVNASPDSFSDAGRYRTLEDRVALAEQLVAEGADLLDIGGQSLITGVPELDPAEEIDRVVPVIDAVRARFPDLLISVDTYKPPVAEAALAAGADLVNDVSGLRSPEMAGLCAGAGAALVLMHTRAKPKTRLTDPTRYGDVVGDVETFLGERLEEVERLGLPRDAVILDPGPDIAKTPAQTLEVLRAIDRFRAFGRPLLLALSRKDFLGAILEKPPLGRLAGTMAALAHVARVPGNIVRVHDVAAARDVIAVIDALEGRRGIPADYELPVALRREPIS